MILSGNVLEVGQGPEVAARAEILEQELKKALPFCTVVLRVEEHVPDCWRYTIDVELALAEHTFAISQHVLDRELSPLVCPYPVDFLASIIMKKFSMILVRHRGK